MYPQQGGPPPVYGMYPYDPRVAESMQQGRGGQEREPAPIKFTEGKLFIGGVMAGLISKDDLVEYCSQWGTVVDAVVMDRKGYGFVTFGDPKDAMTFLERSHELKGRRLDAKAAVPKAHLGTAKLTKKMFVGGTGDLTDQDLKDHFGQYGDIEDAAVVRREGKSRGFGFVTFSQDISVEKCLLVNHYIKNRKVELKRAVPKDEVLAGQGMPVFGFPPGPYGAQPGMMQQQFYPMPYGPGPAPYPIRPGYTPGAPSNMPPGGMPPGDPYGWYGMGYMPYYPAGGMYPPPYGHMVPQPGMAPYGSMAYVQGPGGHPQLVQGHRPPPQQQQQQAGAAGSSSGGQQPGGRSSSTGRNGNGRSRGDTGRSTAAAGGQHLQHPQAPQQQQQQGESHMQPPTAPGAGSSSAPLRVGSDPAAAGSSSSSSQPPPGLPASLSPGAPPPHTRSLVVVSHPSAVMRPAAAAAPGSQRALGPGLMPFAAAAAAAAMVGTMPPGGTQRPGYAAGSGVPVVPGQQQQQQATTGSSAQQQPQQ